MKWNLVVFILTAIFMVLFSACDMELIDFEDAEIVRVGLWFPRSLKNQEYLIFKSADQIVEFIALLEDEWEGSSMVWDSYIKDSVDTFVEKYDETFFSDSILIILQSYGDFPLEKHIKKMYVKNNELYITITKKINISPPVSTGEESKIFIYLIPFKKNDFNGDIVHIKWQTVWW